MNRVQRPRRRGRTSIGQSMVIFALTALVIFVAVGLAVDAGVSYVAANRAERAAAAAALAGVPYMPSQLSTAKAAGVSAAARNGYVTSGNVTVLVYPVPRGCDAGGSTATCEPNQLGASVSVPVATTFLEIVGFGSHKVTQAATAEYLSTLTLGQPDPHLGSTAANLNTPNNYYLLRHEGWGTPRSEGDAYTPNPGASADVHTLNSINEVNMAAYSGGGFGTLPANGGYSYQVVVPSTVSNARINVYNPAFVPNSSNNYRESDPTFDPSNSAQYAVMEYTLYHVADQFDHSKDVPLSQIIVNPANATDASPTNWYDVVTGNTLNAATTVAFYQNWIDPTLAVYPDAEAGGTHLVTVKASHNVDLGPGTYRLRVDTRDGTGAGGSTSAIPINSGGAHKGYALRVMSGAAECAACTLGALNELAFYTPVTSAAGSFEIPIVQVPKTYAGQTINVYAFDPGDVGNAINSIDIVNGQTDSIASDSRGIKIYNLQGDRSTPPSVANQIPVGSGVGMQSGPTLAQIKTAVGGNHPFNGLWLLFKIPIPTNYNPSDLQHQYWKLRYELSSGTATDTLTIAVGFDGPPVHLIP